MKNISSVLVIEKNKIASDVAWLFALDIQVIDPVTGDYVESIRIVRNDEPVTIDGEVYSPFPFEPNIKEEDGLQTLSITIQDQTQAIQQKMDLYGGGVGFLTSIIVVSADGVGDSDSEPELVEEFEVVGASARDYVVTWQLGAANHLNINFPRRIQYADQCSFRYKSVECGYAGGLATCDLTLSGANGCQVHGNSERFGGMPGARARNL